MMFARDQFSLWVQRKNIAEILISAIVAHGSGRPVVFVHGNSSTKAVWANQITFIRQQGRTCRTAAMISAEVLLR
jgi:hypothetical protein